MAFKRSGPSAVPKMTISSSSQISQQKPKLLSSTSTPYVTVKDLQDAMAELSQKMTLQIQQLYVKLHEELVELLEPALILLGENIDRIDGNLETLEAKVKSMEIKFEKMEENVENIQKDIIMGQYQEMEFGLRIRGLKEDRQENLKEEVATSLAPVLGCNFKEIFDELEKVYRINSKVALQRNFPRDVVVYFSRKTRLNEIIQNFYQQKFQIANQDVIILKEIPFKILQKRKDFFFLTQELKNRQIPFRWNIPIGVMVTFNNKRYRLDTIQKAQEFYTSVLKAEKSPVPRSERVGDLSKMLEEVLSFKGDSQVPQPSEAREEKKQIMTRAAYKKRVASEKEKKGT